MPLNKYTRILMGIHFTPIKGKILVIELLGGKNNIINVFFFLFQNVFSDNTAKKKA